MLICCWNNGTTCRMRNHFRIFQIESCTINAIYSLPVHVDERARNRRYIVSQSIFGPISTNSHHPIKNPAYGPAWYPELVEGLICYTRIVYELTTFSLTVIQRNSPVFFIIVKIFRYEQLILYRCPQMRIRITYTTSWLIFIGLGPKWLCLLLCVLDTLLYNGRSCHTGSTIVHCTSFCWLVGWEARLGLADEKIIPTVTILLERPQLFEWHMYMYGRVSPSLKHDWSIE